MGYFWAIAVGMFSGVFCLVVVVILCLVVSFARVQFSEWLDYRRDKKTPA